MKSKRIKKENNNRNKTIVAIVMMVILLTLEKTPSYAGGNGKLIVLDKVTKIPTQT